MRFELRTPSFETPATPVLRIGKIGWRLSGLLGGGEIGQNAHDVALLHDQELLAVELDLGAGPLAEQHAVASLDVEADELAGLVAAARADGDDLALLGLLLGGIRNDDPALGLFLALETTDDDAVV